MPTFTIRTNKQRSSVHSGNQVSGAMKPNEGPPKVWCKTTHWIGDGSSLSLDGKAPERSGSMKPQGRPPKGKVWCETTSDWIGDGLPSPSLSPSQSGKPRGRPPKGKVWCKTTSNWIGDGLPSPSPSLTPSPCGKPRGRPPKGKVWCFHTNEWTSKPKVKFVKRVGSNGQIKYVISFIKSSGKDIGKAKGKDIGKAKTCSTKLNKFIHKQLMAGKVTGVEEALQEGGSLAYFNFDGICSAAENGKIAIFQMIFEKLDYTKLIDKALGVDLCETAEEEGHDTLATYLRSKLENLLDTIDNENLDGLDNYV